MKRKKRIIRMLAAVLAASVLGSWGVPARAAGPARRSLRRRSRRRDLRGLRDLRDL